MSHKLTKNKKTLVPLERNFLPSLESGSGNNMTQIKPEPSAYIQEAQLSSPVSQSSASQLPAQASYSPVPPPPPGVPLPPGVPPPPTGVPPPPGAAPPPKGPPPCANSSMTLPHRSSGPRPLPPESSSPGISPPVPPPPPQMLSTVSNPISHMPAGRRSPNYAIKESHQEQKGIPKPPSEKKQYPANVSQRMTANYVLNWRLVPTDLDRCFEDIEFAISYLTAARQNLIVQSAEYTPVFR